MALMVQQDPSAWIAEGKLLQQESEHIKRECRLLCTLEKMTPVILACLAAAMMWCGVTFSEVLPNLYSNVLIGGGMLLFGNTLDNINQLLEECIALKIQYNEFKANRVAHFLKGIRYR